MQHYSEESWHYCHDFSHDCCFQLCAGFVVFVQVADLSCRRFSSFLVNQLAQLLTLHRPFKPRRFVLNLSDNVPFFVFSLFYVFACGFSGKFRARMSQTLACGNHPIRRARSVYHERPSLLEDRSVH